MSLSFKLYRTVSLLFCPFIFTTFSCQSGQSNASTQQSPATNQTSAQVSVPEFDAGGTYQLIRKQVDFGPRIPGSPAQKACADWLAEQLQPYCDSVYRQNVTVTAGNGKSLPCMNIIGVIHPDAPHRILLLAHWDSRPWADQDKRIKTNPY